MMKMFKLKHFFENCLKVNAGAESRLPKALELSKDAANLDRQGRYREAMEMYKYLFNLTINLTINLQTTKQLICFAHLRV